MARRHAVAALLLPETTQFEFSVACELFGYDRSELGVPWYSFKVCATDSGPVDMGIGYSLNTPYGLADAAEADTIIVVPTDRYEFDDAVLDTLRTAHERGARIVSLCTGAFVLAAAGLLDDRPATTHWMYADEMARRYPRVKIDPNVLYVDDGDILTSAGSAASIDLCLHLVRNDFGAEIANTVARRLVVPPHRDGGQAQYVDHPVADDPGVDWFDEALTWAQAHLGEPITIDDLAERSAMSARTFARRFRASTGTTPHAWLTQQRVQLAQRLLETTDRSVEWIADECGLGTAANLRIHFQRIVCTTPVKYRQCFQVDRTA
jgi:AraC family transcriptional activator FtrA